MFFFYVAVLIPKKTSVASYCYLYVGHAGQCFMYKEEQCVKMKSIFLSIDAVAYSSAFFGQGTGTIWLDDVQCTGNEANLINCPAKSLGSHNCTHAHDAGVRCQVECK